MVESFQWDEAAKYVPWFIPDPECSKEASILLNSMLHLKKKFKAYMIFEESRASSWKELMSKTVETLKELVPKTPELKDRLDRVQMPCSTSEFEDIIPLGYAFKLILIQCILSKPTSSTRPCLSKWQAANSFYFLSHLVTDYLVTLCSLRAYRRHNNLSSVGNMPAPVIAHFILQTR
uniref:Uncharacterized protein n=1 Tax=Oryza punctata TaxID=4537 RepID=A0A0E0L3N3_ORYPU